VQIILTDRRDGEKEYIERQEKVETGKYEREAVTY
jgi:hypothetical protein